MKGFNTFFAVLLGISLATTTFAATSASLTPATISVTAGKQFNVVVAVNPQGTANFAEKVEVDYPADLLSVSTFTLGNNWTPLNQPGYDSIDNTNGVLLKTAGYAGGITSTTAFGTITFTAKKSARGTISFGSGSQAFTASSQAALSGNSASVTITGATVNTTATEAQAPVSQNNDLTPVTTINGNVVQTPSVSDQVAAAEAAAAPSSHTTTWAIAALIVVVLLIVSFVLVRRRKEQTYPTM